MLRKLLAGGAVLLIGYLGGLLFGYRAAVVDYVENDAQTIESMAETMYPTVEEEDLPEDLRAEIERQKKQAQSPDEDDDDERQQTAFQ